ncbi:MAG TPA: proline dehydrogenase family protein [Thermodesulfovibrionales bacterium]|nr:proline dehydrogenase family protein [Thermodesulfovibrionales bacterium]
MNLQNDVEDLIREIGKEIYSSVEGEVPLLFDTRKWMGRIMEWTMKDERFKFQLFRYIDVLPSLRSDALVVEILKEYFTEEAHTPVIISRGIERISRSSFIPYIAGQVIKAGVESIARQFIGGRSPRDVLKPLGSLWKSGCAFSVDLLGEVVVSEREAKEYAGNYLGLLDLLYPKVMGWVTDPLLERDSRGPIPRIDISLKVSSLYSQMDPIAFEVSIERAKENLRQIFRKAQEIGASVCLDMEHYYFKDLILAIFKSILDEFKDYHFAGIALQAYLKDTKEDLLSLIEWTKIKGRKISVRLVKGAYWDYETAVNSQKGWPVPVFLNKGETDLNFEELTRILLDNSEYVRPAIATHNVRSVSNAIAFAESSRLPKNSFEFQMLYGMGEPLRKTLRDMGYRVRVYTPAGELIPGMAYLVRRLLENTSNESFVRQYFDEGKPFEELIKAPKIERAVVAELREKGIFRNQPPMDFSLAEHREKIKDSLRKIKDDFNRRYPLYIGNQEVYTDHETESNNPATPKEVIGRISLATRKEAERAVEEAKRAWEIWKKKSFRERADYLFRVAEEMRKIRSELIALEVYEVGKTWKDADGDVNEAIDYCEYYGREIIRLGTPMRLGDYPGEENEYHYEPRGVGVVISPWNFPLAIPAGMISAGIVTGNCIIFKPSCLSPVTGWKLLEIFRSAGIPPGVLQFLSGPGSEVGEFLVSHPGIDFIAFTGSKDVGLDIVKRAGETHPGQRNIKKVIAEMGGKNAVIIDETADMGEAVTGVLESCLGYQGQKCSACSRVIVIDEVFDEFCGRLREAAESIKIGPPEEPGTFMGPVIDKAALERIGKYIKTGMSEGKTLLLRRAEGEGYFMGPVLFGDVDPDSLIAQEEIFGPVLVVMRAGNIDEAIDIANNSSYALTGGIFSRSPANIRKMEEGFKVGNLYINRKITGALVGRQPFGGSGMSGIGSKTGGPDYLLQFMNPRSISENTLRKGFAYSIRSPKG